MRPHNDVPHPDPDEILHHVRESAARWQETAERIARQRDAALQVVKDIDAVLWNRDLEEDHRLDEIFTIVAEALGR
jgi:hypothetical protein